MVTFAQLQEEKNFLSLHSQRSAALVQLTKLKVVLESLSEETPSALSFSRNEAKIDSWLDKLEVASSAVSNYFGNQGGDLLNDTGFKEYCDQETNIMGEIEIIRESYSNLLKSKNLLGPSTVETPEFLEAIKTLAQNSGVQASAIAQHHKTPVLPLPTFDPAQCKGDPVAWSSFWTKFELFSENCLDDKAKLGFLYTAVRGDAYKIIKNLKCTSANFVVAKQLLEKQFNLTNAVREMLLLKCLHFRPKNSSDYSDLVSAIINLEVYITELNNNHEIDILAETSGANLLRAVIHDVLPGEILDKYQSLSGKEYPTLNDFLTRAQEVADRMARKQKNFHKGSNSKLSNGSSTGTPVQQENSATSTIPASISTLNKRLPPYKRKVSNCMFCSSSDHTSSRCSKYYTVKTRMAAIKEKFGKDPCGKCLMRHNHETCEPCRIPNCTNKDSHGSLACQLRMNQVKPKPAAAVDSKVVKVTTAKVCSVALPTFTAQVETSISDKSLASVSCLLDTAAQTSLIAREVVDRLKIEPFKKEFTTLVGFQMSRPVAKFYDVVRLKLIKPGYAQNITISCLVVDKTPAVCNMVGICQLAKKLQKRGADIADVRLLNQKRDVLKNDILLGSDYFMLVNRVNVPPTRILGNYLLNTIFGQCLIGKIPGSTKLANTEAINTLSVVHVATSNVGGCDELHHPKLLTCDETLDSFNVEEIVSEFSSFSDIGINLYDRDKLNVEAMKHFKDTVKYHEDSKQFECGIPWVNGSPPEDLPHNRFIVFRMFLSTMSKLDKDPVKREQCASVHWNEVKMSFIERVSNIELQDPDFKGHFLHWFPVYKKDPSSTTPCRRVFNGSFRTKGNVSLNDCMLKGPSLTPNILKVQLRMRLKKYLMCSDVSKAFLRVLLRIVDRNYTCFYARENWEDPESDIAIYRFRVVLFGSTASPFLLNATILHLFECNDMMDFLMDCYVDNLFFELDTVEELFVAMNKAISLFDLASMPLREWASNSVVMNGEFKKRDIFTKSEKRMKTLGYTWDFEEDMLSLAQVKFEVEKVTKRSIVSDFCSVYDPLGLVTPVSIRAKVVAQSCWSLGLQWDLPVPQEIKDRWIEVVEGLQEALILQHPRFIGMSLDEDISLHVFADAGDKSLGAVAYLVGNNSTCMIASKAKVCPLKFESFTIPRKELVGISVAARLAKFIILSVEGLLSFFSVVLWSDSSNALTWTLSGSPHDQIFIRNRVDEIKSKMNEFGMRLCYILTDNNPADCLTKHVPGALNSSLWLHGPDILKDSANWIQYSPFPGKVDEIPAFVGNVNKTYNLQVERVSEMQTWNELLIATVKSLILHGEEELRAEHLFKAENLWFKELQSIYFAEELAFLSNTQNHATKDSFTKRIVRQKKLVAPSLCINLNLFLDQDGLVRLFTSLANSGHLDYNTKFPILLPREDHVTRLLVRDFHVIGGHSGVQQTLNSVRTRFWIPKLGQVVPQIIKSCANCRIHFSQRYHVPSSPPLPKFRVSDVEPFTFCGVDMTGHFFVKSGTETVKRFVILFACCSSRAIHVEVAEDASAEAFARCFLRFVARRGSPRLLVSDNGTNLVHFSKDLLSISDSSFTKDLMIKERVEWHFIPVRAAFMGGMYERLIGLFKSVIKRSIGRSLLSLDEFSTVCAYAEASCNDRPLYYVSRQDTGTIPLTPNMLLFGKNLRQCSIKCSDIDMSDPTYEFGQPGHLNKACKRLKCNLLHFRKIWAKEYLVALRENDQLRNKGSPATKYMIVPNKDDVVVFESGSLLKVGKIVELLPSAGSQDIRKVKVESEGHESIQAVANLRRLESGGYSDQISFTDDGGEDHSESIDQETSAASVTEDLPRRNSKRKAAVQAQQRWLGQFLLTKL